MTRSHKGIIIAGAFLILFNLVVNDDWKAACLPAAMLVNTWLSVKETQLSKLIKIASFTLTFALLALGFVYAWRVFSQSF